MEIAAAYRSYVVRVLVLTGAGVSAESGIPTFRGKDGYWRKLDPAQLATPEAFARDPKLVWEWYRERRQRIRNAQPNAAHEAITRLAQHADEFLLVTQNVDDLHARAGFPKEKMVQIHGDIFVTKCSRCDFGFTEREHDQETGNTTRVPRVLECADMSAALKAGHVRPLQSARNAMHSCDQASSGLGSNCLGTKCNELKLISIGGACDVVIVAGTTATFGYIIDWALRAAAKLSRRTYRSES